MFGGQGPGGPLADTLREAHPLVGAAGSFTDLRTGRISLAPPSPWQLTEHLAHEKANLAQRDRLLDAHRQAWAGDVDKSAFARSIMAVESQSHQSAIGGSAVPEARLLIGGLSGAEHYARLFPAVRAGAVAAIRKTEDSDSKKRFDEALKREVNPNAPRWRKLAPEEVAAYQEKFFQQTLGVAAPAPGTHGYTVGVGDGYYVWDLQTENSDAPKTSGDLTAQGGGPPSQFYAQAFTTPPSGDTKAGVQILNADGTVSNLLPNQDGMIELPVRPGTGQDGGGGFGYDVHKRRDEIDKNGAPLPDQFGTAESIARVINIAADYKTIFPESQLSFGDLSSDTGANPLKSNGAPAHSSHKQGSQVDLRFPTPSTSTSSEPKDLFNVQSLVKLAEGRGMNNFILAPGLKEKLSFGMGTQVSQSDDHKDHIHMGVTASTATTSPGPAESTPPDPSSVASYIELLKLVEADHPDWSMDRVLGAIRALGGVDNKQFQYALGQGGPADELPVGKNLTAEKLEQLKLLSTHQSATASDPEKGLVTDGSGQSVAISHVLTGMSAGIHRNKAVDFVEFEKQQKSSVISKITYDVAGLLGAGEPVDNLFLMTLAGDLGQNLSAHPGVLPGDPKGEASDGELAGDIDGFLIGQQISALPKAVRDKMLTSAGPKLSAVLEGYYSSDSLYKKRFVNAMNDTEIREKLVEETAAVYTLFECKAQKETCFDELMGGPDGVLGVKDFQQYLQRKATAKDLPERSKVPTK